MRWFVSLILCVVMMPLAMAAVSVTDDVGHTLLISHPPARLLVLAPDLVENVFAIGAGNRIVGVVQGSDYPPAARKLTSVGSYAGIDLEKIISLHPDLIIAWKYAFPRQLAALQRLGIPVYVAAPKKLEDIPRLMRNLGKINNLEREAEKAASQFEKSIQALTSPSHRQPAPNVFVQIDHHALITINKESWINQVVELCGGKNIFANARVIAPKVNRESILVENPAIILNLSSDDSWKLAWQKWSTIDAVQHQRLVTLSPDLMSRAGPRLAEGAWQLCAALQVGER